MIMLEDAAGTEDSSIQIRDVAELVAGRLEDSEQVKGSGTHG
jgi:hypothetical protein